MCPAERGGALLPDGVGAKDRRVCVAGIGKERLMSSSVGGNFDFFGFAKGHEGNGGHARSGHDLFGVGAAREVGWSFRWIAGDQSTDFQFSQRGMTRIGWPGVIMRMSSMKQKH